MTQDQQNSIYMYDAVNLALITYTSVWITNPVFVSAVNSLATNINSINTQGGLQKTNVSGVTNTKAQQKNALLDAACLTLKAGRAYAVAISNPALEEICLISRSTLRNAAELDLIGLCQNLHDAVNPFIGSMAGYGVSAATQTSLQTALNAFIPLIGTPRNAQTAGVAATQTIEEIIITTNSLLTNKLDGLMEQYKLSDASFYKQYQSARKLTPHGNRTTITIKGLIQNTTHQGINKAHVSIVELASRKKITDASGAYKFMRLKPGTYTIEVVINGFVTQSKTISVETPSTLEFDFTMVSVGPNPN